ncbi:MAG: hypothetical protein CL666_08360 [Balneola sp.]|nr:hypothetical protein [Balneola sp.]|tara:strand:- start:24196 stop:25470 length:1275 start_codon:yes stop_codon:yes gene_type:complete
MDIIKACLFIVVFSCSNPSVHAQPNHVSVNLSDDGWQLLIDGEAEFINGMNWNYVPIGKTYSYSLWEQSDDFIQKALDYEMGLLQDIGVNSIRVYTGIPQKWITYIYENYGIYTMLNHSFGRYGVSVDGEWIPQTNYADPQVQTILLEEVKRLAEEYKNTPGLLLYLIGNENNYGLFWEGAETEDIPVEDRNSTTQARAMYRLMNEASKIMKSVDGNHPVAFCNGDVQFLDIISEELTDVDIFGTNTYRGISFTDLFERVKKEYGKPVLLTEFGSDAYNVKTQEEAEEAQAYYLKGNWKEIYKNASGMGGDENVIGAYTFQFSDGWWKYDQNKDLEVHNTFASWANGGYEFDYTEGQNNMNEEWFGVAAKAESDSSGFYQLRPRLGYYLLDEVHEYNVHSEDASSESLKKHFDQIRIPGLSKER